MRTITIKEFGLFDLTQDEIDQEVKTLKGMIDGGYIVDLQITRSTECNNTVMVIGNEFKHDYEYLIGSYHNEAWGNCLLIRLRKNLNK